MLIEQKSNNCISIDVTLTSTQKWRISIRHEWRICCRHLPKSGDSAISGKRQTKPFSSRIGVFHIVTTSFFFPISEDEPETGESDEKQARQCLWFPWTWTLYNGTHRRRPLSASGFYRVTTFTVKPDHQHVPTDLKHMLPTFASLFDRLVPSVGGWLGVPAI